MVTRRNLLKTASATGAVLAVQRMLPAWARNMSGTRAPGDPRTKPHEFELTIAETPITIDGRQGRAMTLNGGIPGPLMRFKEGETVTIHVHNRLPESTSIHWHGILLPFRMDGVPGVTFPGIEAGTTFTYRYPVVQNGTYWYHGHTKLQEQLGHYGPMIIDPAEPDPYTYDREHIVVLSDWMFENPYRVLAKLNKMSDFPNFQKRTVATFFEDIQEAGLGMTLRDRLNWGNMRMDPTDIADITGHLYTYLMNGQGPESNWTGLFTPGERVRLRVINASSMTFFNVRIPGLPMTVVQADGQNVEPVDVDEFQIGVAETYDVIVTPGDRAAYTIMAESLDRSGHARGTLATQAGLAAAVPPLRRRPLRTMIDMGMKMEGMEMAAGSGMGGQAGGHPGHMGTTDPVGGQGGNTQVASIMESPGPIVARHGPDGHGLGNITIAEYQRDRLGERGTGLEDVAHRVLVYTDLRSVTPYNQSPPDREIELHLTGNMSRYMWSFDGKKFSQVDGPIPFSYGERVRLIMVNDTMMEHPIHLHGMFMELENGHGEYIPRKHTVSVKAGERLSVLIDANARGRWAFHCHFLYHLEMGMFRVVEVTPYEGDPA